MKPILKTVLFGLLWAAVVVLVALRMVVAGYEKPLLSASAAERIEVPRGAGLSQISQEFARREWISMPRFLSLYGQLLGYADNVKAGEYEVTPGMTVKHVLEKIRKGDVIVYQVTFVEGQRYRDYLKALASADSVVLTLDAKDDAQIAGLLGSEYPGVEGLFYPDTYFYEKGTTDLEILMRAHQRMQEILHKEWQVRSRNLPYTSPYEALIMASIVEKESGAVAEREKIAGVFVRRLQSGMRLQTDPTVIYGLGESYDGNLTRQHLTTPTPYNTYLIPGLPPTPIASPGVASIRAALHPMSGDELFFVAKGDGSHQFSVTLEEHEKAVQEYQLKRRSDYRSAPRENTP